MLRFLVYATAVLVSAGALGAQLRFERRCQPTGRAFAGTAADLNRSRVVLFGGHDGNQDTAETWEWDGTCWTQSFPPQAPVARNGHAMAYDANRGVVVLYGGQSNGAYFSDTWEWNGLLWMPIVPATVPPARAHHGMTYDPTLGRVVMFGGTNGANLADTWEWDGTEWSAHGSTGPSARRDTRMAYDYRSQAVLLYGGRAGGGETWLRDSATRTWVRQNPQQSPPATYNHGLAEMLTTQTVVMFGGNFNLNQTWQWTGRPAFQWLALRPATSPSGRQTHAMAGDPTSGGAIVFSGSNQEWDTWSFDGTAWSQLQPTPGFIRRAAAGCDEATGDVILHGGPRLSATWAWNGSHWRDVTPTNPFSLENHTLTYANTAQNPGLIMFGGDDGSSCYDTTRLWTGANWSTLTPAVKPPGRSWHAASKAPGGGVLVFGGRCPGQAFDDTWLWDGTTWTNVSGATTPGKRSEISMASDGNQVVLFGGRSTTGSVLGDTWIGQWNGSTWTWTRALPTVQPPARVFHRLAYDPARQQILMFGGFDGNNYLNDLWVWDSTTSDWVACPAPALAGRATSVFVAEVTRRSLLIFGGANTQALGDTWTSAPACAAAMATLGVGCSGSLVGIPNKTTSTGPTIGNPYTLQVTGLPQGGHVFVYPLLGLSALGTPFDICPPLTCPLYISSEVQMPPVVKVGSSAQVTFTVPYIPTLCGLTFYNQVFGLSASSQCLPNGQNGLVTTNALQSTVGVD